MKISNTQFSNHWWFSDLCYSRGQDLACPLLIAAAPLIPWATSDSVKRRRYVESGYPLLHTQRKAELEIWNTKVMHTGKYSILPL